MEFNIPVHSWSNEFIVKDELHKGYHHIPVLFLFVLGTLSYLKLNTGISWDLLSADDLVIIDENPQRVKIQALKGGNKEERYLLKKKKVHDLWFFFHVWCQLYV